jgi:predicted Zn-dependent protease
MGIQLGAGSFLLKYSRADEAQADSVGAIIMYKAGYDPRALAQFFAKLEKESGPGGPQFLSDHPNPGNRVQAVDKEIADWPTRTFVQSSPEFAQIHDSALKVKAYSAQQISDGAQQGIWARQNSESGALPRDLPASENENSAAAAGQLSTVSYRQIQPSDNFKTIRQGGLVIAAPDNWQVHTDSQSGVLVAPPAGVSAGAIAYGVLVHSVQSNANSLDQATQQLVQNLQQSNSDLEQNGSIRSIRVNGTSARSVDLLGTSPIEKNGQAVREHDWLVTFPASDGSLLYLIFISPDRDFDRLRPTFEKMLNSMQLG